VAVDPRRVGDGAKITQGNELGTDDNSASDPQRVDDAYQPKGIELGDFLAFPLLDLSESYNSNVYATETDAKGDFISHIAPEIQLRSQYPENQLNFLGRLDQSIFTTYHQDDHLDGIARVDGIYNFSSDTQFTGLFDLDQTYEDRGSPDDKDATKPTRTRNAVLMARLKRQFGRLTLSEQIDAARRLFENVPRFDNPIPLINTDRDRYEISDTVRAAYELFPGYAALLQGTVNTVDYDHKYDQNGFERSSNGYNIETGFGVDLTQLIRGDFLVGYLAQYMQDPRLANPHGLAFQATFNWTPDRRTVIVPTIQRTVLETTIDQASVIVQSGGGILVRHELQRNLVLTASSYVYVQEFKGTLRTDWLYDNRVRAIWSLSPDYYVGGELGYRRRTSTDDGNSFSEAVALIRFGIRM
jgi:hypothetical protein